MRNLTTAEWVGVGATVVVTGMFAWAMSEQVKESRKRTEALAEVLDEQLLAHGVERKRAKVIKLVPTVSADSAVESDDVKTDVGADSDVVPAGEPGPEVGPIDPPNPRTRGPMFPPDPA